jgi:hypothetical protein
MVECDDRGHWLPGCSANPGGRPSVPEVIKATLRELSPRAGRPSYGVRGRGLDGPAEVHDRIVMSGKKFPRRLSTRNALIARKTTNDIGLWCHSRSKKWRVMRCFGLTARRRC